MQRFWEKKVPHKFITQFPNPGNDDNKLCYKCSKKIPIMFIHI